MTELDFSLGNDLVITDALQAGLQELDMLMSTERTELIGNPTFGLNMEQFLWDLSPSASTIKSHITEAITNHTCWFNKFPYEVDVECEPGTERTIYTVKIIVKANSSDDMVEGWEYPDNDNVLTVKEYVYK